MGRPDGQMQRQGLVVRGVVLAALYIVGAKLGLALDFSNTHVSAVWPPTGIAVAALMLCGPRVAPGIYVGAVLANVLDGVALPLALGIGVGNTLAPLAAYGLVRRFDVRPTLERLRDTILLPVIAMASMTISATAGVAMMSLAPDAPADAAALWRTWWVGDAMGVILVAPLFLSLLATPLKENLLVVRWKRSIIVLASLGIVTYVAVVTGSAVGYIVVPLALWAAMRFEQSGAAISAMILSVIDTWHVSVAPEAGRPLADQIMTMQGVNATIALLLLAFASVMHERRKAQDELRGAAAELEARVESRTAALARINTRLKAEVIERRVTEAALRASEERLEEAQRLAHIGSFQWDAKTDRNEWSDELLTIYGLPPGHAPGFDEYISFIHESVREDVRTAVQSAVAASKPLNHEYPVVLRDGTRKWVHAYIQPIVGDDGALKGLRGTCQDITERRNAEEAMRWSERFSRQLLESAPDAVVVVDPTGTIIQVNEETSNLLGYERIELLGQAVEKLLPDALHEAHQEHRSMYNAAPARRSMGSGKELYALHKDGALIPVDVSLSPVETDTGFVVLALVRDASERRQGEEALRTALDRERDASEHLRKLNDAKNAFLSAVSHELRTPLTAILGFAELLKDDSVRSSREMTTELIDRVFSSANRLGDLLGDILDIDRLSRGVLEPRRRSSSLYRLIDHAIEAIDTSTHPLTLDVKEATIYVDPAQAERIIENLVTNAIKYTPGETPITLRARGTPDDGLMLVVSDDGPGIPSDLRATIFDPFVRGDSGNAYSQGTGIGLALVDRFAQLHGGRAWLEESPSGGASFHVHMPGPVPSKTRAVA
ncbi:MAG: MASE1 domain-containing protein [Actinomycetota bacterium]